MEQKAAEDFLRYCHAKLFAGVGPQAAIFLPCSFVRCLAYIENGRQKNFRDFYSPQAVFEMRAIVAKLLGIFGES